MVILEKLNTYYFIPIRQVKLLKFLKNTKDKLLKCFKLKEDAEFVIANSDWSKFYTKELNRFYSFQKIDDTHNVRDFLNEFCFVNYCAYSTGINSFNFFRSTNN